MDFKILIQYPAWYFLLCLLAGLAYAVLLYYRDRNFSEASQAGVKAMAILRFLLVSVLAFLLLSPLVNTTSRQVEKPIIIVGQDNSESVLVNADSAYYASEYPVYFNEFVTRLNEYYDVRTFSYGDGTRTGLSFDFSDKQTDITDFFQDMESRFTNRNVGAVILASDGLYNKGSNPLYATKLSGVPVYTVALGDTNVQRDLILTTVKFNPTVYLGNNFPLEIHINARKLAGETTRLTVRKENEVLKQTVINITNNNFSQIQTLYFDANETGNHKYVISLDPVEGEISNTNNSRQLMIEVLEGRNKLLLLAHSPHPDIATLKAALEENQNYSIDIRIDAPAPALNDYTLVILHQYPAKGKAFTSTWENIQNAKIPVLFIIGSRSSIADFNRLNTGLTISDDRESTNESQPALAPDFSLFSLSQNLKQVVPKLPPLQAPFGNYNITTNHAIMLYQQVGQVRTNYPLLLFLDKEEIKNAVITGEGIWKWRLREFADQKNSNITNEIILKSIQYLSVRETKNRFRVITRKSYNENEPVFFSAEVYNPSYELVNDPDVSIEISGNNNQDYPFTFSRTERSYTLNSGILPPGDYTYKATVKIGNENFTANGRFTIHQLQIETNETVADHALLYNLSGRTGGEMFYPAQLSQLADYLTSRDDIRPVTYEQARMFDIIDIKLIFFILLALLSLEWFLRKRSGTY